jgi:hypothetical protein
MLGSYVEYGEDSEQYKWLVQDLAGVDRGRTPWVIVGMHAPWCAPADTSNSSGILNLASCPLYRNLSGASTRVQTKCIRTLGRWFVLLVMQIQQLTHWKRLATATAALVSWLSL